MISANPLTFALFLLFSFPPFSLFLFPYLDGASHLMALRLATFNNLGSTLDLD